MLVTLQCDPGLSAGQLERSGRASVGGVPQIWVHLEHRTGVDLDQVAGLVAIRIVRVGGMRHVGRSQQRDGQPAQVVLPPAPAGEHDAFQNAGQQVGLRAVIEIEPTSSWSKMASTGRKPRGWAASNASMPA